MLRPAAVRSSLGYGGMPRPAWSRVVTQRQFQLLARLTVQLTVRRSRHPRRSQRSFFSFSSAKFPSKVALRAPIRRTIDATLRASIQCALYSPVPYTPLSAPGSIINIPLVAPRSLLYTTQNTTPGPLYDTPRRGCRPGAISMSTAVQVQLRCIECTHDKHNSGLPGTGEGHTRRTAVYMYMYQ